MKLSRYQALIAHACLIIIGACFLAPFAYIVLNSFKTTPEIIQVPQSFIPHAWTTENYSTALHSPGLAKYFVNSTVITSIGVFIVLLVSALGGYGFARLRFRGDSVMFWAIIATATIPLVILLVPLFLAESRVGLLSTWWGLILPDTAITLPFALLIMRSAFIGIPIEVEEAAKIDGCGLFRQWWAVMLPLTRNGLMLVVIVSAYTIWGEYTVAKVLALKPSAMPLSVGFTLLKGEVWQFGLLASVIVLALIPPVAIFVAFRRHIVAGVAQGAIKG